MIDDEIQEYEWILHQTTHRIIKRGPENFLYDDCIQNARVALWKGIQKYNKELMHSKVAYLKEVVKRSVLDTLRDLDYLSRGERKKYKAEDKELVFVDYYMFSTGPVRVGDETLLSPEALTDKVDPCVALEYWQTLEAVERALRKCTPRMRELLRDYVTTLPDMLHQDVTDEANVTPPMFSLALRQLKKNLEKEGFALPKPEHRPPQKVLDRPRLALDDFMDDRKNNPVTKKRVPRLPKTIVNGAPNDAPLDRSQLKLDTFLKERKNQT